MQKLRKSEGGFTLIEILVVIGIIAILAAIVLIALNPARQFAQARQSQRTSNVNAVLNAIGQNVADNQGLFSCGGSATPLPSPAENMDSGSGFDMRDCIVPDYMPEIPVDPSIGVEWDGSNYDTGYEVEEDANGRVQVCAPEAANETAISGADVICVTR